MMKKQLMFLFLFFLVFTIIACNGDATETTTVPQTGTTTETTEETTETTTTVDTSGMSDSELATYIADNLTIAGDLTQVTSDLTLPTEMSDVTITWSSDNPDVITDEGVVTRPANDNATVTLTANFTVGDIEESVDFVITVLKSDEVHTIDYQFQNSADADLFSLGDVQNMHDVSDGQLTLTHTGVTDYPSKGSRIHISTNQFPYVAFYVSDLTGSDAKWAVKVHINDSYEDYTLISDTSSVGLVFADLRDIDNMPVEDDVKLDMYIYILGGEGASVSFDFITSTDVVPETTVFDDEGKVSVDQGTAVLENDRLRFVSEDTPATIEFSLYTALDVAQMLDVFVLSIGDTTTWSLETNGITLIDNADRHGAFTVDLIDAGLTEGGNLTYTITYQGELILDSIANKSYGFDTETFDYESIDALLAVWNEHGAARLDLGLGNESTVRLSQALPDGDTVVSRRVTTNFSTHPKFVIDVDAMSADVALHVKVDGITILSDITSPDEYTVNLIDFYFRDMNTATVELMMTYTGTDDFDPDNLRYVDIDTIDFLKDDAMSMDALPPKGDSVTAEGGVAEYGFNDNNWAGNARTIARDGQIMVINSDWYSKAEVFAQNVDVNAKPFVNIKVDAITDATTWVLELIINPNAENETVRLIGETSALGTFSFDLRDYTEYDTINLLSYSVFVVGGAQKVVTIDYLEQSDTAAGPMVGEGDDFSDNVNWTSQDNMSFSVEGGQATATLNTGGFGKVSKTFIVDVSETPYLYVDIQSIGGTWKLDPGLIAESADTGEFYVDLAPLGNGIITLTLDFFVVGDDGTELIINAIDFVTENPNETPTAVPDIFDGFTPALDISAEYVENQYIITLNSGGYGKMEKDFTIDLSTTPYLYIDVASVGGNWKVDPLLLAETSETGEFYLDLTSIGTGEVTFSLDIFVVGSDGAQLVINDMAFVESIPEQVPTIFEGWEPALDVTGEYTGGQFVLTLNSGTYGKVEKNFTVDLTTTPYLYIDVASVGGNWKLDPALMAETSDTGEFYIDLSGLGTGETTFKLDLFIVGSAGAELIINDMAFVESIPTT